MRKIFRIHGDNIIECERIVKIILKELNEKKVMVTLLNPSVIVYSIDFKYNDQDYHWIIELLPGFNKNNSTRWEKNIFKVLSENGSFLDETPDVIITTIDNNKEIILCAIEFCSALQAGNQAWQRSGRAFSTGRAKCPYLYVVDFVKYELDAKTRKRKALRFPNPAVPFSYINYSRILNSFVAQIYIKSEEFDKNSESILSEFDENNFGEIELQRYILKLMCGLDCSNEIESIFNKNLNMVKFLAKNYRKNEDFSPEDWNTIYLENIDIIEFAIKKNTFPFKKTITKKGQHGNSLQFVELVKEYSVGLASIDLPFGIIPSTNKTEFINRLKELYPEYSDEILNSIISSNKDLFICIIKGFKPKGDDNRPDRGILPFLAMLTSENIEILTYLYGPILEYSSNLLESNQLQLAFGNGLWKSILSLSDYLALDVPLLSKTSILDKKALYNTSDLKKYFLVNTRETELSQDSFHCKVAELQENDVDTGIHFLFKYLLKDNCFEGMCNPPGGDWSGLSLLFNKSEYRWLSLPRVSENGKRPDHVIEIFGLLSKPILLLIESKELSKNLENNIGEDLKNYLKNLMDFSPSVKKELGKDTHWEKNTLNLNYKDFEIISAAAYLNKKALSPESILSTSKCDLLFILEATISGWKIEIVCNSNKISQQIKKFIEEKCNFIYSEAPIIIK